MLISLLAAAVAYASPIPNSCAIHLTATGRIMPEIEIDYPTQGPHIFASDAVASSIHWDTLRGRELRVVYTVDGTVESTSRQKFFGREQLIARYPDIATAVEDVNGAFAAGRRAIERKFSFKYLCPLMKHVGLGEVAETIERCYPGEFAELVLRMPTDLWTSDQLSSWSQPQKNLFGRFFRLHLENVAAALDGQIKAFAYDYDSLPRPLLRVYLVHNHPGVMDPLSPVDLRTQQRLADRLSKLHDMFDFEVVLVALAHLDAPGDVVFVRTVSRVRAPDGQTSTWTADGESKTHDFGGRNRLKPRLNPPRRRRQLTL